jgi:hypothetical protein
MRGLGMAIAGALVLSALQATGAERPDFTGAWTLDGGKSDEAVESVRAGLGDKLAKGKKQMFQRYLAGVLVGLADDAEELEIEQTEKDIKIFDRADNVNIYYIDGKKHMREEQSLGTIDTVTSWNGDELVISSEGKEVGRWVQVLSMEGPQMVVSVTVNAKDFPNEIMARFYYDRAH